MKNIHLIPTDKPSRLLWSFEDKRYYSVKEEMFFKNQNKLQNQNIYITNSEEIKEGDWFYCPTTDIVNQCESDYHSKKLIKPKRFKIILTDNKDLIKEGVQKIDDKFLKWFVKNPSCEKVDIGTSLLDGKDGYGYYGKYKIIIPKEERKQDFPMQKLIDIMENDEELRPKQETLEEGYNRIFDNRLDRVLKAGFTAGAKWQQEQIGKSEFLQRLRGTLSDAEARRLILEQFKKK